MVEGRLICCGKMSLKSIVRELKEMRDGIGSMSRRGVESRRWNGRTKSHVAPDVTLTSLEPIQQGQWANLPPELLLDIIRRVEDSETTWPARAVVVYCGSVCKSWRAVTKEIVKTPEQCGRLTFPISLKQVINSSPLVLPNLFSFFPFRVFCFLCYVSLLCMNSLVLVILQYSVLSGGTEKLQHICCTLAWYHVSLLRCFIADACHFFLSRKRVVIFLFFKLLVKN